MTRNLLIKNNIWVGPALAPVLAEVVCRFPAFQDSVVSQISSSASVFDPASPVRQAKPRAQAPGAPGFALPKPEFRSPRGEDIASARRQDVRNDRKQDPIRDPRQDALARRDARDAVRDTVRDAQRETRENNGLGRRERVADAQAADDVQARDRAQARDAQGRDPWAERAADAAVSPEVATQDRTPALEASPEAVSAQAYAEVLQAEEGSVEDTQGLIEAANVETLQLAEPVVAQLVPEASLSQVVLAEAAETKAAGAAEIADPAGAAQTAAGSSGAPSLAGAIVAGAALAAQQGVAPTGASVVSGESEAAAGAATSIGAKEAHGAALLAQASGDDAQVAEAKSADSKPADIKPADAKALQTFAETLTLANQAAPSARTDIQTAQTNLALAQGAPDASTAQAAAEQRPSPEATRPTPMHALPLEIGLQAMAGSKRFDIRLDPAELGRVDVRLEFNDDGTVTASLTADRVETLQMLQRDARTLERAFEQAGLKSSEGGIDFQLRDQGQGERQAQREQEQQSSHSRRSRAGDDAMTEMKSVEAAVLRRLARPGGVDLVI